MKTVFNCSTVHFQLLDSVTLQVFPALMNLQFYNIQIADDSKAFQSIRLQDSIALSDLIKMS